MAAFLGRPRVLLSGEGRPFSATLLLHPQLIERPPAVQFHLASQCLRLPLRGPSLFSFLHPPLFRRLLDLLELLLLLSFRRLQLFIDLLLLKTAPPPPRIQNPPPQLLLRTELPLPEFHLPHFLLRLPTRLAPPQFHFRLGGLGFHLSQAQRFVAQEAGLLLPLLGGHAHALALVRPFVEHEYAVGPALGVAGMLCQDGLGQENPGHYRHHQQRFTYRDHGHS